MASSTLGRLTLLLLLCAGVQGLPQRNRGGNRGGATRGGATRATAQQQAAQIPGGVSTATDGSTIMDATVNINNLPIRFKFSAPASELTTTVGGQQQPGDAGTMGINVLLHGDGGQSFFDFPNQAVQNNLMGVALLAPDPNLFWGGGSGLQRTDGVAHSQAVADFVTDVLPQMVAFNQSQVFFTGVSGGSLMLSGFFVPAHMSKFSGTNGASTGVMLNCGAMAPQVDFVNADQVMAATTIHFQSTQQELAILQQSIPQSIAAYEQLATTAGLNTDQINSLQTVNNAPNGGHCAFDEQGFVSGVQLMANSYSAVIQEKTGQVTGIGNVLTGVVGNENLQFAAPAN